MDFLYGVGHYVDFCHSFCFFPVWVITKKPDSDLIKTKKKPSFNDSNL